MESEDFPALTGSHLLPSIQEQRTLGNTPYAISQQIDGRDAFLLPPFVFEAGMSYLLLSARFWKLSCQGSASKS